MGQFEPTLKVLPFFLDVIFQLFGIYLVCLTPIFKCLYVTMALEVSIEVNIVQFSATYQQMFL